MMYDNVRLHVMLGIAANKYKNYILKLSIVPVILFKDSSDTLNPSACRTR